MRTPVIAILASLQPFEADPSFPRPTGHYAVWLSSLFHALQKQTEYEIHWVTLSKDINKTKVIQSHNQTVHILPRGSRTVGLYTFYFRERALITKELKQINPDLIHTWGTEDCYSYCAKKIKGAKLLSIQGLLTSCKQRGAISRFLQLQSLYEISTLKAYPHITAESPWAEERLRELIDQGTIHHFEYAVQEAFWHVNRTPSEHPTALYGGSDTPLKNVQTLIEAFSDPRLSHIQLHLAGIEKENHPGLPPNIQCLGRISRENMVKQLGSAWCLVHASLADCAPNIVNEARVMGVPVIVSTECGSKQHVDDGKSGFILNPLDIEGFIRSTLYVCSSRGTTLKMGAHGQEKCREALSAETMLKTLLQIYQQIL